VQCGINEIELRVLLSLQAHAFFKKEKSFLVVSKTNENIHRSRSSHDEHRDRRGEKSHGSHGTFITKGHGQSEYLERSTIPLNNVPAWTPAQRLQVVIIGAGYSGVMFGAETPIQVRRGK